MKPILLLAMSTFCCLYSFGQPNIDIESFGTGFDKPVGISNAGDSRLFIVEQQGYIQILNSDGSTNVTPFLDINSLVIDFPNGDERGLLGLAFHPNYSVNGYFYVNYINNSGDTVISRFSVSANPNLANSNSELIILSFTQPDINHNGGHLAFGPDGYLYISSGDGGGQNDPGDNSQNTANLLGSILRIDVDNTENGNNYAIPAGNPFIGDINASDEIWAYGLRNPWKFSFDSSNGNLWIADVGQWIMEEINMITPSDAGINFGWRCYEGSLENILTDCPPMNTLTFPVAEYTHNTSGNFKCSITGGYVHRGSVHTEFNGYYFFADYCSNEIGTINYDGGDFTISYSDVFSGNFWTAFGEDINGELYIAGGISGTIYKIVPETLDISTFYSSEIKLFPNPTSDVLHLSASDEIDINEIAIYDISGKQVDNILFNKISYEIQTKHLANGLYLISFANGNGEKVYKKFVKQ